MKDYVFLPAPKKVEYRDGTFSFGAAALEAFAGDARVGKALGALYAQYHDGAAAPAGVVSVGHDGGTAESYTLDITPERLEIRAPSARGRFTRSRRCGSCWPRGRGCPACASRMRRILHTGAFITT